MHEYFITYSNLIIFKLTNFQENSVGKSLLDYAIESRYENNLLQFLSPCVISNAEGDGFEKGKLYIRLINRKLMEKFELTLTEYYPYLVKINLEGNPDYRQKFFVVIFSLLEEIGTIDDIAMPEIGKEKLLKIFDNNEAGDFKTIRLLLALIVAYCTPNTKGFRVFKTALLSRDKSFFEMIFSIIELSKSSSFEAKFLDDLEKVHDCMDPAKQPLWNEAGKTRAFWINVYSFILLMTAVNNSKNFCIDIILKYNNFEYLHFYLPPNMRSSKSAEYLARKMLEHGYDFGKRQIPPAWFTPKSFQKFLDSRIHHEDGEKSIELNCSFLLDSTNRNTITDRENETKNKNIFCENTKALDFILSNESLQSFITHPTIATYIDLKMRKWLGIQTCDFISMLVFVILFFMGVTYKSFSIIFGSMASLLVRKIIIAGFHVKSQTQNFLFVRTLFVALILFGVCGQKIPVVVFECLIALSLSYIIIRNCKLSDLRSLENFTLNFCLRLPAATFVIFLLFLVIIITHLNFTLSNTTEALVLLVYLIVSFVFELFLLFKNLSRKDIIENFFLDAQIFVLCIYYFINDSSESSLTSGIILFLVPLCGIILIFSLHSTFFSLHFIMLQLVAKSFIYAVGAFLVVLISFTVFFELLLGNKIMEDKQNQLTQMQSANLSHSDTPNNDKSETENKNTNLFAEFLTAFLKVVFMTTGEYSVEDYLFQWYHAVYFLTFAAITIVIFNLITGLALDDVQQIRKESRRLVLVENAKFLIKINNFYTEECANKNNNKSWNW